jgi:hypothetical protein
MDCLSEMVKNQYLHTNNGSKCKRMFINQLLSWPSACYDSIAGFCNA